VADVERQAEQETDGGRHAHQHAEHQVAHQAAQVVLDVAREAWQALASDQAAQPAQLLHAARHAGVERLVVVVAGHQSGHEQPDAGDGRVQQRQRMPGMAVGNQVMGFFRRHQVLAEHIPPAEGEGIGHRDGGCQVSQHRHELGAEHLVDQDRHRLDVDLAPRMALLGVAVQGGGDARGGHGRLLGGDGEVQHVHQHEAEGVVEAVEQGLDQRRTVLVGNQDLDDRHAADEQPGAGGGAQHGAELGAALRDIVFAGAAGVFGDVARQQVDVVAQQAAHLVLGVVGLGQFLGQRDGGGAPRRQRRFAGRIDVACLRLARHCFQVDRGRGRQRAAGVHQVEQLAQAVDALGERHQHIGQRHAGAGVECAAADLHHHLLALVEHHQQVAGVFHVGGVTGQYPPVAVEIVVGLDVLHQEGRIDFLDFHVGMDQARLQAERAHAAGQGTDRVQQTAQGGLARRVRRRVRRPRRMRDHVEQFQPVAGRHRAYPLVVVFAAEHAVEGIRQVEFVERRRQDAVGHALL
jgi:hypothetical protein